MCSLRLPWWDANRVVFYASSSLWQVLPLSVLRFMKSRDAPAWLQMEGAPLQQAGRLPADGPQMVALSEQWDGAGQGGAGVGRGWGPGLVSQVFSGERGPGLEGRCYCRFRAAGL